jgi:signal transduction histidine kinase/ligand-binding sensor domain-containing protein
MIHSMSTASPPVRRIFAILASIHAMVAVAAGADSAWLVQDWQSKDGLPDTTGNVLGLAQTDDGHLWLASRTFLTRFDGGGFESFRLREFGVQTGGSIRRFLRSRDDALWLAVDGFGVVRLHSGAAQIFKSKTPGFTSESLTEAADGAIWVTDVGGEFYRIKEGAVTFFAAADGLPDGRRTMMLCDKDNRLWFVKGGYIGLYRNGRFETLTRVSGSLTRLAAAASGGIWITNRSQLFRFNEGTTLKDCGMFQARDSRAETRVLLEDRNGAVWLGSNMGLIRYDGSSFENVPTSDREIMSLLEDREGNLWAGTGVGGLNRIRAREVAVEDVTGDATLDSPQSICEDANGIIWAATVNGSLAQRTNAGWKVISILGQQRIRAVTCVMSDRSGALWIGTSGNALYCWQNGSLRTFGANEGLQARNIQGLYSSSTGDVWIYAAPGLLQCLQNGEVLTLQTPPEALHFHGFVEDARGDIWIGADRKLLRASKYSINDESSRLGGERGAIRCLYMALDQSLWIGFNGGGVGRLKDGKFALISNRKGLLGNSISHIVDDTLGWLWLASERGVFKVQRQQLESVADGQAERLQSIAYQTGNDAPDLLPAYGTYPAAFRSSDGRLWMAMRSGVAVINPGKVRHDPNPPLVLLKRFSIDERTAALYRGGISILKQSTPPIVDLENASALRVQPGHHWVQFDFAALSLRAPENVQFRYRLSGFDEKWTTTAERSARYSRLTAGNYKFEVSACNSDGVWNTSGASFAFSVTPFFWQTNLFRFAVVVMTLLIGGLVSRRIAVTRLRRRLKELEQERAVNQERVRIARDLHDDLGSSLIHVALLSDLAKDQDNTTRERDHHLDEIGTTARQLVNTVHELVWAVNPKNDRLPAVAGYLGQYAVDFLRPAGIQCLLKFPAQVADQPISAAERHNLLLAVREAINNIAKHSGATQATLQFACDGEGIHIVLEDNGNGFDPKMVEAGNGLGNMRSRLESMGGACSWHSAPGGGTKIVLKMPLHHSDGDPLQKNSHVQNGHVDTNHRFHR